MKMQGIVFYSSNAVALSIID